MKSKDQYIIAYITDFYRTDTVLSYASWLAEKLHKGLILLHISDPSYTKVTPEEAGQRLHNIIQTSKYNVENATYAALKGNTRQVIAALPSLLGAVVVTAQVDSHAKRRNAMSRKAVLRDFADCKTAFLVAQEPLANPETLKDVAMAIDFKKESKDKLIWSSYFPRFCECSMHVLYYDYKDEFLHNKWYATMTQLHKLYNDLDIKFQPHVIESKSTFLDINAMRFVESNGYGLLIAVTTKEKDGLEFFIGVQEKRTIVNKAHIPILFLNPREDLYVLCD